MSRQLETLSDSSAIAGTIIDSLAFAREGRRLVGQIAFKELPRLAGVLVDVAGAVEVELLGELMQDGDAYLLLRLAGDLHLRCQRCLETVVEPLRVSSRFLLVAPGQPWPDDELAEDGFDAIAAEREMALLPLIEDEMLLALPIAPRHESCEPPVSVVEEHDPSPFAALGKWKRNVGEG
jgi:uncharacterized protein